MTSRPILELDDVYRSFRSGPGRGRTDAEVLAVAGVSLDIEPGSVVGLLGHNGAGKTTLVRLLAGLLAPTAGQVRVAGLDPIADGVPVRRLLGVMPTASILDVRLTARRNLELVADLFGVPRDGLGRRISKLLDDFELGDRADDKVDGFSAGMRQRLALARVLLPEPSILLLDEPSAALDPLAVRMVRTLIGRLARESGRTVVLCTHDLSEAQLLCDQVVVLDHGRVVALGSPAELTARLATGSLEVEVAASGVDRARAALADLYPTAPTAVPGHDGDTMLLRGGPLPREQVPLVVRTLAAAGVDVFGVRPHDPTLEDVYVALYEKAGSA